MATVSLNQNVANSPTNSYPVGIFKQTNGTELQAVVLVNSIGAELTTFPISPSTSTTATSTNVSANTSSVTLLAANTSRKGATIFNDSTVALYLKLGTSANPSTSFTVLMVANAYYEVPFNYIGIISGIWTVSVGYARVVELT